MTDRAWPERLVNQRFIPIALVLSIGLNLFFAGAWLGAGVRQVPSRPPGGPLSGLEQQLRGRLTPDGMEKVGGLIEDIDASFREYFSRSEALRRQLHTALVTEPFDSNAFLRLLDQLNIDHAHFDGDMSRHIARIVASLSPEDRRVFADAVLSMPPGPLG